MTSNRAQRRFLSGGSLGVTIAWVALIAMSGGLMGQSGCIPPIPLDSTAAVAPGSGTAPLAVTLTGTAVFGTPPYTQVWTVAPAGPTIADPTQLSTTATINAPGTYTFTLTVTDSATPAVVDTATAAVTVTPAALVANAGLDKAVAFGASTTLDGSATGGTPPLTFAWALQSGVAQTLSATNVAQPTLTGSAAGTSTYQVTVTDSASPAVTATDTVVVTVSPPPLAVTASASPPSVTLPATSTLGCTPTGGTGTYHYSWLQTGSTPAGLFATIAASGNQNTQVSFPSGTGSYTFTVTVTDSGTPAQSATSLAVPVTVSGGTSSTTFTTSLVDNLVGTTANDVFDGSLYFNPPDGLYKETVNNTDRADGLAGTDTMLWGTQTAGPYTPALSNIEAIQLTAITAAPTLDFTNISGVTSLTSSSSTMATTVTNVPTVLALGISNNAQDLTLTYKAAATSGSSDSMGINLSGVNDPVVGTDIIVNTGGTNGLETVTFNSDGAAANRIVSFTLGAGTSLANLVFAGSQKLTIDNALVTNSVLDTTVTVSSTGGVVVTLPNAAVKTAITGGTGDDTFKFPAGTFISAAGATQDSFNGGTAGTDTLGLASVDAVAVTTAITNVTNVEKLAVTNALAGDLTLANFGSSFTGLVCEAGITTAAARAIIVPSGASVEIQTVDTTAGGNAITFSVGGTGTADTMTLQLSNSDGGAGDNFQFTGIETLTINSAVGPDGTVADGTANVIAGTTTLTPTAGGGTGTITVTGTQALTLTGATTAGTVNATALTGGGLTMTAGIACSIQGSAQVDALIGSALNDVIQGNGGADILTGAGGNDVIIGNDGNDVINGGTGQDTLTGGAGTDTFQFLAGDSGLPSATNYDTISDFEKNLDVIDMTAGAIVLAAVNTPAAATVAAISAKGIATFDAADDTLAKRITAVFNAVNLADAVRATVVFEFSGNSYVFISNGGGTLEANDLLIQLAGVTGLTEVTLAGEDATIK